MAGAARGVAAALAAALLLAACQASGMPLPPTAPTPRPQQPPVVTSVAVPVVVPVVTPVAQTVRAPRPPSARPLANRTLAAIAAKLPPGAISIAVRNTVTGAQYAFGGTRGMWMGSVYKLLVLESLLLARQRDGGWFSAAELADITEMIEASDNQAGYRMYLDAGGSAALTATALRLGLRHTRPGISDPTFTIMDAWDGIALLRALVASTSPLDARSRAFTLGLMRNVEADQRWGAGVVADPHTLTANKNGWTQVDDDNGTDEDDGGRWLVNSLGIVRVGGQPLLISIFTEHNPDLDSGIALVERLARTITPVVVRSG